MSTGLTYLSIYDGSSSAPEVNAGPMVFSSYDEAYEWGRWYMSFAQSSTINVLIKTFSPGVSGYWQWTGLPEFTPWD